MTSLPYSIDCYVPADAEEVLAFFRECCDHDDTIIPPTEEGWASYVGASANDGGREFRIARRHEAIVGVALSTPGEQARQFRIFVHPDARRGGIGTALLRAVADQPGAALRCSCRDCWTAGKSFLQRFGFARAETDLTMDLVGPLPEPAPLPNGVTLRPDRGEADDETWLSILEIGFADGPDYTAHTPDDLARRRTEPNFALWFAEADGEVVGLCHGFEWNGEWNCVNAVVVAPAWRGRGLGRALTTAGVRSLHAHDPDQTIRLWVREDNAPAHAVYKSLGFQTTESEAAWLLKDRSQLDDKRAPQRR